MIGRHLLILACAGAMATLLIVRPFLPGAPDPVAVPLSTGLQLAGVLGLPGLILALCWLGYELRIRKESATPRRWRFRFAAMSVAITMAAWIITALVVMGVLSVTLGILALCFGAVVLWRLIPAVRRMRTTPAEGVSAAPGYLIALPAVLMAGPILLADPLTSSSRARTIRGGAELISAIEAHRARHGSYPQSLLALHPDFLPPTAGVERYHYARSGDAYNLAFEQPRFLLDDIGAREVVVYNPLDQHTIVSHAAWILEWNPAVQPIQQGWFASRDTGTPHWKYFLFD